MRALLLATTNRHKLEEFRTIFSDLPLTLQSLREVQIDTDVEETGQTFAELTLSRSTASAIVDAPRSSPACYLNTGNKEQKRLWRNSHPFA